MTTYEYLWVPEFSFSGYGGFETWDGLGAKGWKLVYVKPADPHSWVSYLFMRESA